MKTTTPTRVLGSSTLLRLAVTLLLPIEVFAQTVGNPDFDVPALPVGTLYQYDPPTGAGQPWAFTGRSGVANNGAAGFCTFLVADANYAGQYAYIQKFDSEDGSISQTVTLSSPGTFKLSFLEAGRIGCSGGNLNYTVTVSPSGGGTSVLSVTNSSASGQPFTAKSYQFITYTQGDYILTFASLSHNGGNDNTTMIDSVLLERLPDEDLLATIHCSAVDVCWAGRTNQLYQPQYRSNLSDTNWYAFGPPVLGTGTNCVTDGINGMSQRFYRIVRVP